MGDTSGIFHILLYIYYRTYVGVCVTPFFFFFGVRCAQYKVHAQCSFAALAPCMPCMLLVIHISKHDRLADVKAGRTYIRTCVRKDVSPGTKGWFTIIMTLAERSVA